MSEGPNDGATLWAWVTRDDDGGVCPVGAEIDGMRMPLIVRDRDAIESMREDAQAYATATGQRVWLREFTGAIDHGDA